MPKQPCLQRRAGVRARGENSGYGQPKGGQKGGLFPSIIIKTLILNIIVMDYGAPHTDSNRGPTDYKSNK